MTYRLMVFEISIMLALAAAGAVLTGCLLIKAIRNRP